MKYIMTVTLEIPGAALHKSRIRDFVLMALRAEPRHLPPQDPLHSLVKETVWVRHITTVGRVQAEQLDRQKVMEDGHDAK